MTDQGFQPNWYSPPGATISDMLSERKISVADFASQIGISHQMANGLLVGEAVLDTELAIKLQTTFGGSTSFWLKRESLYREDLARFTETKEREANVAWLATLPLSDMRKLGWLSTESRSKEEKIEACFNFFGVPDLGAWRKRYVAMIDQAAFRTSTNLESNLSSVAAWLRRGELMAESTRTKTWSAEKFRKALPAIRSLTREKDVSIFLPKLKNICADCGVALSIVKTPKGCAASGATRFLSDSKALMLLSFRHLSDDQFWFTFFHEAAHLILHGKNVLFIEDDGDGLSREEQEANEFAARILIPIEAQEELRLVKTGMRDIVRFSRKLGVSPGIVVGQLQHCGRLAPRQRNTLKRRFAWKDIAIASEVSLETA